MISTTWDVEFKLRSLGLVPSAFTRSHLAGLGLSFCCYCGFCLHFVTFKIYLHVCALVHKHEVLCEGGGLLSVIILSTVPASVDSCSKRFTH